MTQTETYRFFRCIMNNLASKEGVKREREIERHKAQKQ